MEKVKFNERLRQLRTEKRLTQAEVAHSAKISLRYYQGLEAGTSEPSLSVGMACVRAVGVSYAQFMREATLAFKGDFKAADFRSSGEFLLKFDGLTERLQKIVFALVYEDEELYSEAGLSALVAKEIRRISKAT